jgi:hypothetical protein
MNTSTEAVSRATGSDPRENAVTRWFGVRFSELHPLLQELHRHGGDLHGTVEIRTGTGVGGWVGRRIAAKMGIPVKRQQSEFEVHISHANDGLHWDRRFGSNCYLHSTFQPVGNSPSGYWIESTGPVRLHMTVDIVNGGWHWRCLRAYVGGLRVPLWLFPRSKAYKQIHDGQYVFSVNFSLPLLGSVLSYQGMLSARMKTTLPE